VPTPLDTTYLALSSIQVSIAYLHQVPRGKNYTKSFAWSQKRCFCLVVCSFTLASIHLCVLVFATAGFCNFWFLQLLVLATTTTCYRCSSLDLCVLVFLQLLPILFSIWFVLNTCVLVFLETTTCTILNLVCAQHLCSVFFGNYFLPTLSQPGFVVSNDCFRRALCQISVEMVLQLSIHCGKNVYLPIFSKSLPLF
jgi:hypothetical protein